MTVRCLAPLLVCLLFACSDPSMLLTPRDGGRPDAQARADAARDGSPPRDAGPVDDGGASTGDCDSCLDGPLVLQRSGALEMRLDLAACGALSVLVDEQPPCLAQAACEEPGVTLNELRIALEDADVVAGFASPPDPIYGDDLRRYGIPLTRITYGGSTVALGSRCGTSSGVDCIPIPDGWLALSELLGELADEHRGTCGGCVAGCAGSVLTTCTPSGTEVDCANRLLSGIGFCNPETLACESTSGELVGWVSSIGSTPTAGSPLEVDVTVWSRIDSSRAELVYVAPSIEGTLAGWTVTDGTVGPVELRHDQRATRRLIVTPPASAVAGDSATLRVPISLASDARRAYIVTQELEVGAAPEVPSLIGRTTTVPDEVVFERWPGDRDFELALWVVRIDGTRERYDLDFVLRGPGGASLSRWLPAVPATRTNQLLERESVAYLPLHSLDSLDSIPSSENLELEYHLTYRQTAVDDTPVDPGRVTDLVVPIRLVPR